MEKNSKNISTCDETSPKGSAKLGKLKQKKLPNKWQKRFAVGCLAVLMCGTALFGVACTPTTATSGAQGIGSSSSANGGSLAGTNTSPFGLDPANDPVVYTTASGLEIKCSNALTNTNLASYTYFTMGEYDGTPVNWVIIGYDPSVSDYVGEYSGEVSQADPIQGGHSFGSTVDDSPMGNAIKKEMFAISNSAVDNDEIGDGCVLCFSEYGLGTSSFGSNYQYEGSALQTYIQTLYDSGLKLKNSEKTLIEKQSFETYYYAEGTGLNSVDQYLFPLSALGEKFTCQTYLDTPEKRKTGRYYWLRSGHTNSTWAWYVIETGGLGTNTYGPVGQLMDVRPAFVMKLA